ncbi:phage tail protein [Paenibacillus baekrokdamisoli]|uniref:Phage tail protein n=1 Tax=Paenibacillus baekrokdamisoli TaxID=1712516 RepID=A0A3G9ILL2_9BACL|nr:baseplate J/gp47 family protein [Paenibacillus baekrokdamisoli]MBB3070487.1 putative phage protein gp47/JayE [Paenibacillus baekrokdamisoli]BBH19837.1 phage tail protein [Paenibacillus baekrokdamisoli]
MYESQTFSAILQRMLDSVPSDVDKREGSIIYDALAPAAQMLAETYIEMAINNNLSHAQTSSGAELRKRGEDFGITAKLATAAVREGSFKDASNASFDVPIGSRFSAGELTFVVSEKIAIGTFKLVCETSGEVGNLPSGAMLPIEYISGLATATLLGLLLPGTNDETDDDYRKRFLEQVRTPPTSGNRAAYRTWALEVPGVGDAYVIPTWNGPNTVKVFVLGVDRQPATPSVVKAVKDYIDPAIGLGEGMGEGVAPAGALTTVVAAPGVQVNVTATVVLSGSQTLAQVKMDFERALTLHLAGIAYSEDRNVKYARIGTLLLDTTGVADYAGLEVNGGTGNVTVSEGSVAVKGTVIIHE